MIISGGSFTSKNLATGALFCCLATGNAGSFTVPRIVLECDEQT
jgi:hypothetical protein